MYLGAWFDDAAPPENVTVTEYGTGWNPGRYRGPALRLVAVGRIGTPTNGLGGKTLEMLGRTFNVDGAGIRNAPDGATVRVTASPVGVFAVPPSGEWPYTDETYRVEGIDGAGFNTPGRLELIDYQAVPSDTLWSDSSLVREISPGVLEFEPNRIGYVSPDAWIPSDVPPSDVPPSVPDEPPEWEPIPDPPGAYDPELDPFADPTSPDYPCELYPEGDMRYCSFPPDRVGYRCVAHCPPDTPGGGDGPFRCIRQDGTPCYTPGDDPGGSGGGGGGGEGPAVPAPPSATPSWALPAAIVAAAILMR